MMIGVDVLEDSAAIAKANDIHTIGFMERDFTQIPEELDPVTENNSAYFLFCSNVPFPVMNSVMCLDRNANLTREQIREIVQVFRTRGNKQMWWLGEHSTPDNLGESLAEFGLEKDTNKVPMMGADLTNMDFSPLESLSKTKMIQVKRVATSEDLTKWLQVTQEVYKYPDSFIAALGHIYETRLSEGDSAPIQNFIAEIKGTPVGVSSLYLCEGLAGLYYVSTKEEHRGKGVGTAVTLAAMKEGRERGYEVGILGASQLGFNVYQRVGFKEYYKLQWYLG